MKPTTTTKTYYLLRFFRKGKPDCYAMDTSFRGNTNRSWAVAKSRKARKATRFISAQPARDAQEDAYHFKSRTSARRVLKSPAFEDLLKGEPTYRGRDESTRYFWEIVKITETIVTSFAEEIVVSDAPPMLTLARAASVGGDE